MVNLPTLFFPIAPTTAVASPGSLAAGPSATSADLPAPSAAGRYFGGASAPGGDATLATWLRAVLAGGLPVNPLTLILASLLPPEMLRGLAEEAIREGRAPVDRSLSPSAQIDQAMGQSWTPKRRITSDGVVAMSQGDYNTRLGNGDRTIRSSGCFLTSLTMAATKLTGDTSLDPQQANDRVLANGGFSGSGLVMPRAAEALGMRMTERSAVTYGNAQRLESKLDGALAANKPVVAGVDYKAGSSSGVSAADHFITITGKNPDGSYRAVDPAGGREIRLAVGADGLIHSSDGKYTVSELTFLDRA